MAQKQQGEYELTVITPLSPTSAKGEKALKKVEANIKEAGKLDKKEDWGEKKLAYPIKKHQSGFYHFFRFHASPATIANLDKSLKLNDNIIRYLIIAVH